MASIRPIRLAVFFRQFSFCLAIPSPPRLIGLSAAAAMVKSYPVVSAEYLEAVEKARQKLRALIAEKNCSPLMLRLA